MRITVRLSENELQALATMARDECRDVREQARFIIVETAKRRGLLINNRVEHADTLVQEATCEYAAR